MRRRQNGLIFSAYDCDIYILCLREGVDTLEEDILHHDHSVDACRYRCAGPLRAGHVTRSKKDLTRVLTSKKSRGHCRLPYP